VEPGREAHRHFFAQWQEVPDTATYKNGFRTQWEEFLRHVAADTRGDTTS
jgi:hypothetical protein